jgi:S1-C subfamily serine protease
MKRVFGPTARALRTACYAVGCVALGVLAGRLWPGAAGQAWREAPATGALVPSSFADVVALAQPAVVAVRAEFAEQLAAADAALAEGTPAAELPRPGGQRDGSGFVVNGNGLVVTSRHVVAGAAAILVLVPGHDALPAVIVGEDVATDLALLRLLAPPVDLSALPLGRSEELRAGDWIVAMGNPYGFAQTVTAGVVSFVGRHLPHSDLRVTADFVQISAPVNPGSSGGPVLALDGTVIGVTTKAAAEAQGISFAVPSRTLKWVLSAMARSGDGRVRRGYLGIEFRTPASDVPGGGAQVLAVAADAPAAAAGLAAGDLIVAVDGQAVADANALHERIVNGAPGEHLALRVLRAEQLRDSIVVLGEMGARAALPWN